MIRSVPHAFSGRLRRRPLPLVLLLALLLTPLAAGQDAPAPPPGPPATEDAAPAPDAEEGAGADTGDDATAPDGGGDGTSPDADEAGADGTEPADGATDEAPGGPTSDAPTSDDAPDAAPEGTAEGAGTDGDDAPRPPAPEDAPELVDPEEEAPGGADDAGDAEDAETADGAAPDAVVDPETRELRYAPEGELRWTLPLPESGGPASNAVVRDDAVLVGHGLYLLEIDRATGEVRGRRPLPAPASELLPADGGGLRARLEFASGTDAVVAVGGASEAPVRFDADPGAFGWLQAGAASRSDPAAAAERDPRNPWLLLAAARATEDDEAREAGLDAAAEAVGELPFFERARLARALEEASAPERAAAAMEAAIRDFAERGYDPRLLTDPELRDAYGFPLVPLREATREGDLATALRWAPHAWRLAAEEAPETVEGLRELAAALREADERDAADLWRRRAAELRRAGLSTWLDAGAVGLGRFGHLAPVALLGAFVLAWLVLLAKVWRAQSLARRQRRERDDPVRPWTRLWVPRHASTTEKISLLAILVLAGFAAALAGWGERTEDVPRPLRSGTLASLPAREALAALPDAPWGAFARGASLHVRGETEAAEAAYVAAGERAPALVNLGLLRDDETLLQAALRVDPRNEVARWHLDRAANPSPFHEAYLAEEPLLAMPTPLELALASAGEWGDVLRRTALAPWEALPEARPAGVPTWAWWIVLGLYALILVALLVSIAIPRPRASREAPRTWPYHPLALLVPGSGHLDELWGLLLLVPWAPLALDAILQWRTGEGALQIPLRTELLILAALHLANLVGYVVETLSYRRRMRLLREEKPELARSYGLPTRRPAPRGEA